MYCGIFFVTRPTFAVVKRGKKKERKTVERNKAMASFSSAPNLSPFFTFSADGDYLKKYSQLPPLLILIAWPLIADVKHVIFLSFTTEEIFTKQQHLKNSKIHSFTLETRPAASLAASPIAPQSKFPP